MDELEDKESSQQEKVNGEKKDDESSNKRIKTAPVPKLALTYEKSDVTNLEIEEISELNHFYYNQKEEETRSVLLDMLKDRCSQPSAGDSIALGGDA